MTPCDVTAFASEKLVSNHLFLPYYHSSSKLEFLWEISQPSFAKGTTQKQPDFLLTRMIHSCLYPGLCNDRFDSSSICWVMINQLSLR